MNEIGKISCCKDQLIHIQNKYLGADQRFFWKASFLTLITSHCQLNHNSYPENQKNKIYDDHYKSSKDTDRYFRKYESQIILFAGAEHILQENGIDLKQLNTNKLQAQISELISRKKSINTQYVSFRKEMKELELIHQNLSKYLKPDDPEIEKSSHNKLPSL